MLSDSLRTMSSLIIANNGETEIQREEVRSIHESLTRLIKSSGAYLVESGRSFDCPPPLSSGSTYSVPLLPGTVTLDIYPHDQPEMQEESMRIHEDLIALILSSGGYPLECRPSPPLPEHYHLSDTYEILSPPGTVAVESNHSRDRTSAITSRDRSQTTTTCSVYVLITGSQEHWNGGNGLVRSVLATFENHSLQLYRHEIITPEGRQSLLH